MKKIVNIVFLLIFCLCSLQLVSQYRHWPMFSFFLMIFRSGLDEFIFLQIIIYLLGIAFVVLWGVTCYLLKLGNPDSKFPICWIAIYPLFILIGIFLFQVDVWDRTYDYLYLTVLSVILVLVANLTVVRQLLNNGRRKSLYYIIASLYLFVIVMVCLPNSSKKIYVSTINESGL